MLDNVTTELAWIRQLARALLKDAALADDVAQDAWLAAAGKAPADRPLRPWLSRVVLNLVRMHARGAKRRAGYEAAAETGDATPRADEMLGRVETQRVLVDAVLGLDEPYRSTVLLHYFEGLTSVQIGRRLGISDVTVRRRLQGALARLRARLEQRGGDNRRAWIASVAGLAGHPDAWALAMNKLATAVAILALVGLIAIVAIVWPGREAGSGALAGSRSAMTEAVAPVRGVEKQRVAQDGAGRRVAGRVVFDGRPVAGAAVSLRDATRGDTIADVVTRADGTFSFGVQPLAAYAVTASAPDRSPGIVRVELDDPQAHADALVVPLADCAWRTVGTVADAGGSGIPRASLRIDALVGVDTNANGHYELCRPPGSSLVTASADGYGSVTAELGLRGTTRRDFTLAPEAILVGHVVREATGEPVADARVVVVPADNPVARVSFARPQPVSLVHTISGGAFQISGLAPGRVRVAATAPGLGSKIVNTYLEAGTSKDLAIIVAARSRVAGHVTAGGEPVSGAKVTAVSAYDHAPGGAMARSQADGSFVIDGVARGPVQWEVRGYDVSAPRTTVIDRDEVANVVIEVAAAASIRGRVTSHGAAVVGAEVECDRFDWAHGFGQVVQHAQSDVTGSYTIENAAPGECELEARSPALGAVSDGRKLIVGGGGVTRADIELGFDASVTGVVVDQLGAPLAAAHIRLVAADDSGEAMTDDAGAFTIRALRGGTSYQPMAAPSPIEGHRFLSPSGGDLPAIRVPDAHAAVSSVKLVVRSEYGAIRGKVIDDQGLPVSDVRIQIEYGASPYDALPRGPVVVRTMPASVFPNLSILGGGPSAMTDGAGHFELRQLVPGRYNVRADGADGASTVAYDVATSGAEATIRLPPAGAIEGTLIGFTATPAVIATDHTYNVRTAIPDAGHFSLRGLRPGSYSVVARDGSGAESRAVEVRAAATTRVELRSRGAGRIEGRVVEITSGEPAAGVRCVAAPAAGGFAQWWSSDVTVESDGAGRFTLDPVPVGPVHVECWGRTWARVQRKALVAGGTEPTTVQLTVVPRPEQSSSPGFSVLSEQLPPTVIEVVAGGAAAKAGLAIGDQIVEVDGLSVEPLGVGGLEAILGSHRSGTAVVLAVVRGSKPFTTSLILP